MRSKRLDCGSARRPPDPARTEAHCLQGDNEEEGAWREEV